VRLLAPFGRSAVEAQLRLLAPFGRSAVEAQFLTPRCPPATAVPDARGAPRLQE